LVHEIYRRRRSDDVLAASLLTFCAKLDVDEADGRTNEALQASLALRATTMPTRRLREFLYENEGRVCVVAAGFGNPRTYDRGTGFLIGPDRVLTTYHTLFRHIDGGQARKPLPGPLYAIFDHFDGEPIEDPEIPDAAWTRVAFHADWHLASSKT